LSSCLHGGVGQRTRDGGGVLLVDRQERQIGRSYVCAPPHQKERRVFAASCAILNSAVLLPSPSTSQPAAACPWRSNRTVRKLAVSGVLGAAPVVLVPEWRSGGHLSLSSILARPYDQRRSAGPWLGESNCRGIAGSSPYCWRLAGRCTPDRTLRGLRSIRALQQGPVVVGAVGGGEHGVLGRLRARGPSGVAASLG
jgi:hypothetical protein